MQLNEFKEKVKNPIKLCLAQTCELLMMDGLEILYWVYFMDQIDQIKTNNIYVVNS